MTSVQNVHNVLPAAWYISLHFFMKKCFMYYPVLSIREFRAIDTARDIYSLVNSELKSHSLSKAFFHVVIIVT